MFVQIELRSSMFDVRPKPFPQLSVYEFSRCRMRTLSTKYRWLFFFWLALSTKYHWQAPREHKHNSHHRRHTRHRYHHHHHLLQGRRVPVFGIIAIIGIIIIIIIASDTSIIIDQEEGEVIALLSLPAGACARHLPRPRPRPRPQAQPRPRPRPRQVAAN